MMTSTDDRDVIVERIIDDARRQIEYLRRAVETLYDETIRAQERQSNDDEP